MLVCLKLIVLFFVLHGSQGAEAEQYLEYGINLNNLHYDTEYVVIPQRGILLTRTGTLLAHPSYDILTVIVALDKLPNSSEVNKAYTSSGTAPCSSFVEPVERSFKKSIEKLKSMTEAIFETNEVLSTNKICEILDYQNCSTGRIALNPRKKRIVGAYLVAGAALATASTALGLSIANKIELEKLESYIVENSAHIQELQTQMLKTDSRVDVVIDTQRGIIGYIKNLTETIEMLAEHMECLTKYVHYSTWASSLLHEIEGIMQFIFEGKTFGRLNPRLLEPRLLKSFLDKQHVPTTKILQTYPNILYQTAIASLIDVDFDNLQFTFMVTYPNFANHPIYPHFSVQQTGFQAYMNASIDSMCLHFNMPNYAVIHDNKLYALNAPIACPSFGRVMICSENQFSLVNMDECLRTKSLNISSETSMKCPLIRCDQSNDLYISTPGGMLLRTAHSEISLVYSKTRRKFDSHDTAQKVTMKIPQSRTTFIPWRENITAVQFGKSVVYSPINAENFAKITVSIENYQPKLNWSTIFEIPDVGAEELTKILENQQSKLAEIENEFKPTIAQLRSWASKTFGLPGWIKNVGILIVSIVVVILFSMVAICCRKCNVYSRVVGLFKKNDDSNYQNLSTLRSKPPQARQSTVNTDSLTMNPIYPTL